MPVATSDNECKILEYSAEQPSVVFQLSLLNKNMVRSSSTHVIIPDNLQSSFEEIGSYLPYFKEVASLNLLEGLKYLRPNWNGNGADGFDGNFIDEVKSIVISLDKPAKVFPTGRKSVQLEYEKDNGDYLEFEVYPDRIVCFQIKNNIESENVIPKETLNKILSDFYAA